MSAKNTVRHGSPGYGQAVEVIRNTLPQLAVPIETHVAALRREASQNRLDKRRLESDLAATRVALEKSQLALRHALGCRGWTRDRDAEEAGAEGRQRGREGRQRSPA